jgi:protein TonB
MPAHTLAAPAERSIYHSRRLSPGSAVAALALAAAAFWSFQFLGVVPPPAPTRALTVVTLADLTPPPSAPDTPVAQPDELPRVPPPSVEPRIVVPPPIVVTPAPAPAMAVALAPVPPAPTITAPAASVTQAAPGPSAPSPAPAEGGDLSSRMISAQPPTYPVDSRRLREQGTVVLSVLLATDGRVERLSIARSSGFPRLDHAASSAVRRWRWSPTMRDGQPVPVQGNVVIPFVLRG